MCVIRVALDEKKERLNKDIQAINRYGKSVEIPSIITIRYADTGRTAGLRFLVKICDLFPFTRKPPGLFVFYFPGILHVHLK